MNTFLKNLPNPLSSAVLNVVCFFTFLLSEKDSLDFLRFPPASLNVLLPRPPLMDNPPKPEQYVVDAQVQSYSPPSIFSFHPVSIWPFLLTCISSITINVNYIPVMLLLRALNHIGKYRYLLDGFNSMSQRYFKLNISKTNFNIHNIPTANLTFIQHFLISLLPLPVCTSQKIMF